MHFFELFSIVSMRTNPRHFLKREVSVGDHEKLWNHLERNSENTSQSRKSTSCHSDTIAKELTSSHVSQIRLDKRWLGEEGGDLRCMQHLFDNLWTNVELEQCKCSGDAKTDRTNRSKSPLVACERTHAPRCAASVAPHQGDHARSSRTDRGMCS